MPTFERPHVAVLRSRLSEPRHLIQVVAGPRQVGKTTLVRQATQGIDRPVRVVSADEPTFRTGPWIAMQWELARDAALAEPARGAVLVIDEVQKLTDWPETVKRLWDEDTNAATNLVVVLLGSAPLLIQQGLTESLAGRFEVIRAGHWSLSEMRSAFGLSLEEFVFYGAYPGAARLIEDPERWRRYLLDSLIETTISRDVLMMARVDKPALLRRLFELACRYSGQILSYNKMLGQLQDAGNTTTLAHYLELLAAAGMVVGLQKHAGDVARARGSSPKLQVLNTALMSAQGGLTLREARSDHEVWGRLVESAVGAHLANAAAAGECALCYWRERDREVDFVVRVGSSVVAIEVKSGRAPRSRPGLDAFGEAFRPHRSMTVGGDGVALEEFLSTPVRRWVHRRDHGTA